MALLYLLPALLLALLMLLRRYPGERQLVARARRRGPASTAEEPVSLSPRGPLALTPRGRLLIACSLAVRPPPIPAGLIS